MNCIVLAECETTQFLSYGFEPSGYSKVCPECGICKSLYSALHRCWICLSCGSHFLTSTDFGCPDCLSEEVIYDQELNMWYCKDCDEFITWDW